MRRIVATTGVVLLSTLLPLASVAANTHVPTPSTWKLNVSKSDFGTGPAEKSETMVVLKDTDKWLSFTDVTVDAKGHASRISWSGPADGTMHPIKGMPGGTESWNAATDSGMAVMPDGTTMTMSFTASDDKKVVTFKVEGKMKGGETFHQTLVYERTK